MPLDFFVLDSAAGPLLGPIGQGAYPAANAELDALAWARHTAGLPALSVAWGQWAEAGMAARMLDEVGDVWSERGLGWIDPAQGFDQLERLLGDGATCAAVLPIDWGRFVAHLPVGVERDFFSPVVPALRRSVTDVVADEAPADITASIVETWRDALPVDRRRLVVAHLADRTRHVLGTDEPAVFDEKLPLKEVGLDSLMAVELRNVLTRSLATSLPATLLFDYPSLDTLAAFLMTVLGLVPDEPGTEQHGDDAPALGAHSDLADLSDEEAEALLLAELAEPERNV
jgi:acyl carrier protein